MSHTKGKVEVDSRETLMIRDDAGGLIAILTHLKGPYGLGGRRNGQEVEDNARRLAALWNAAEDLCLTTEKIAEGIIQMTFAHNHERSGMIEAALERIEKLEAEKAESEHALGLAVDAVERLEAEKGAIVDVLEKILVDYTTGRAEYNHAYAVAAQSIITKERKEK